MQQFYITIKEWLDANLWLTIVAFVGLYCLGWLLLLLTVAVEFIFGKKGNSIEKVAEKIYPFCNNLCRNTLYGSVLFLFLSFIMGYLLPMIVK